MDRLDPRHELHSVDTPSQATLSTLDPRGDQDVDTLLKPIPAPATVWVQNADASSDVSKRPQSGIWSQLAKPCHTFLRALGLELVPASLTRRKPERKKIAMEKGRLTSIIRALVHTVPVAGAIALIYLNWQGLYLGAYLKNISLLQFAAKLHELTIQASLAAILFTYIRHELALGVGLPFGALLSGLQITQVSYLWSMEFWGSASSPLTPLRRRLGFAVIFVLSLLLAATVGPASALAMIPRLGYWPAGKTHIWLGATNNDIWPSSLNSSLIPISCSDVHGLVEPTPCPSNGWQELLRYSSSAFVAPNGLPNSNWKPEDGLEMEIGSTMTNIQIPNAFYLRTMNFCTYPQCHSTMVTTQQECVSRMLTDLSTLWDNALYNNIHRSSRIARFEDRRDVLHTVQASQPFTHVLCNDQNEPIEGSNDTRPIYFPYVSAHEPWGTSNWANLSIPNLTRAELFKAQNASQWRTIFIDPTGSDNTNLTIGAIVLRPRSSSSLQQTFYTCWISSGWGASTASTSTGSGYDTGSGTTTGTNFSSALYQERTNDHETYLFQDFPLRHISITPEWADFVNPSLNNFTVVHILLSVFSFVSTEQIEATLGALITNGLARVNSGLVLEGNVTIDKVNGTNLIDGRTWLSNKGDFFTVHPEESKDWTKLEVSSLVEGLQYNAQGFPIRIALAILTTYVIMATCHFIYACVSGISSTSWDSVSEVTALALNSPPTEHLQGTCAGIERLKAFQIPVRVLAAEDDAASGDEEGSSSGAEHLHLVFGNVDREYAARNRIRLNKEYGSLKMG